MAPVFGLQSIIQQTLSSGKIALAPPAAGIALDGQFKLGET